LSRRIPRRRRCARFGAWRVRFSSRPPSPCLRALRRDFRKIRPCLGQPRRILRTPQSESRQGGREPRTAGRERRAGHSYISRLGGQSCGGAANVSGCPLDIPQSLGGPFRRAGGASGPPAIGSGCDRSPRASAPRHWALPGARASRPESPGTCPKLGSGVESQGSD